MNTARVLERLFPTVVLVCFLSPIACGQPERDGNEARLPDAALGKWVPVSRSVSKFGNLTIGADALTWGECVETPYRVVRSTDAAVLLELVRSPPCRLVRDTPFWVEISAEYLVVSWCQDASEIEKPLLERACSSGRLKKLSDQVALD